MRNSDGAEEADAADDAMDAAAASAASSAAAPLPPLTRAWQRGIALAVRELLRLARFGPNPVELQLALATYLKESKDEADAHPSTDGLDLLADMQEGIHYGSALPSTVQELPWTTQVLGEITIEVAAARAAETLAWMEAAATEATARVTAAAAAGGAAGAAVDAEAVNGLFKGAGAMCVFVCAPGPVDTLAAACPPAPPGNEAAVAAAARAVRAAHRNHGPEDGGGLAERLADNSARRSKFRALITGADLEDEGSSGSGDEDDDEDEDGGDEEDGEDADGADGDGNGDGEAAGCDEHGHGHGHSHGAAAVADDAVSASGSKRSRSRRSGGGVGRFGLRSPGRADAPATSAYGFAITPLEVLTAIAHGTAGVEPTPDIAVPAAFVEEEVVNARAAAAKAAAGAGGIGFAPAGEAFAPSALAQYGAGAAAGSRLVDAASGVTSMRLRNGLTLTYLRTPFEPRCVQMRLVARGGRSGEGAAGVAPARLGGALAFAPREALAPPPPPVPLGAVALGASALGEGGCCGMGAVALARACALFGIHASFETLDEYTIANVSLVSSAARDGASSSLARALQLLHGLLFQPSSDARAFARAKDASVQGMEAQLRSLDSRCALALADQAFGPRSHMGAAPDLAQRRQLTHAQARAALATHFDAALPHNLQLVVVGDFSPGELEALAETFLGPLVPDAAAGAAGAPALGAAAAAAGAAEPRSGP
jgi:hypothetical protein